jgi:hypothetical protein
VFVYVHLVIMLYDALHFSSLEKLDCAAELLTLCDRFTPVTKLCVNV